MMQKWLYPIKIDQIKRWENKKMDLDENPDLNYLNLK